MIAQRCPHCRLPFTEGEIGDGCCPACRASLVEPAGEAVPPSSIEPASPRNGSFLRGFLVGCGCVSFLIVGLASLTPGWWFRSEESSPAPTETVVPETSTPESSVREQLVQALKEKADLVEKIKEFETVDLRYETSLEEARKELNTTRDRLERVEKELQGLQARPPAQTPVEAKSPAPEDPPKVAATTFATDRPGEVEGLLGWKTWRLDRPGGEVFLPVLEAGRKVKVIGRVGKLRIGSVQEGAVLDAEDLLVEEVDIPGSILGAEIRMRSPGMKATFGEIGGRSRVAVSAPGGSIECGDVHGNAWVEAAAREVRLTGIVGGTSTLIRVQLPPEGRLSFHALQDTARLLWKTPKRTDRVPHFQTGIVAPGARFGRSD